MPIPYMQTVIGDSNVITLGVFFLAIDELNLNTLNHGAPDVHQWSTRIEEASIK